MIISTYPRHSDDCPNKRDRHYRRCRCPKWLYFVYRGKKHRRSARTRSWEQAEKNARNLEREYEARDVAASEGRQVKAKDPVVLTVQAGVQRFLEDKRQQGCAEETLTKLETLFEKQFVEWADEKGLLYLAEVTLEQLENFRKSWRDKSPLSKSKKQERVKGFFWFALRHGWIKENPAAGLSRILADDQPVDSMFSNS